MRSTGYAPLRDYAAIGDGRTAALIASDGSIDWLCLPNLDSASVFAAVLDVEHGGCFRLAPDCAFTTERRYLPETNVLETTFITGEGVVRVIDALVLPGVGMAPSRELTRRVEGVSGRVPMRWRVEPRFAYGGRRTRIGLRGGIPVASCGQDAFALSAWGAGEPVLDERSIGGSYLASQGHTALIALSAAHQEPLLFPSRAGRMSRSPWNLAAVRG